ncbi:MAG: TrkH family potassium uptake protein [Candidatus Aenigmarchaeota archaeon]|nr:TrkH family potassium uptake protein [Candidatus Aenigmarchaeota archaeon]
MNWKSVFSYLGFILIFLAVAMLLPAIVSLVYDENVFIPFFLGAFVSFLCGVILIKKFRRENLTLGSAMILAGLAFIVVSLLGSIAYLDHMQPLDAVFESVSGFTATGFTTASPESLPHSILFWRSLTQWLGGAGMLLAIILLLSSPGMSAYYMYKAEAKMHRIETNVLLGVKKVFMIYGIYTCLGILLFVLVGMPVFDSVNHAMTAISNGGFSVRNQSLGYYASPSIELVAIVLSILGATSIFMHKKLFKKDFSSYIRSSETQLFWLFAVVFASLVSFSLLATVGEPLRSGVFHTLASLTSTSFTTGLTGYTDIAKVLLVMAMVIGGFAGSLAGGLKLVRVGVLGKAMTWISKKIFYPSSAVVPFKFNGRTIDDQELTVISLFSFTYIFLLIVSSLALSFMGYATTDAFFVSASAEGTVGLSTINIAAMNPVGKIILMAGMLLGRLEILPFFVLFFVIYSRIKYK